MNTIIAMFSLWPGKNVAHSSPADAYFLMFLLVAALVGLLALRNEQQTIKTK